MGLINALGNLGGFAGPYLGGYLQDAAGGSFLSTAVVLAVALLLAGLVMLTVRDRRAVSGGTVHSAVQPTGRRDA